MYEHFRTDPESEVKGVIQDYGEFRVTLARAGGRNHRYQKAVERLSKPYRRAIQTETLSVEKSEEILKHAHAEAVVLNWEVKTEEGWKQGIHDSKGDIIPFTRENVLAIFDELPDLYEDIKAQAGKVSLYLASLREEAAKN